MNCMQKYRQVSYTIHVNSTGGTWSFGFWLMNQTSMLPDGHSWLVYLYFYQQYRHKDVLSSDKQHQWH